MRLVAVRILLACIVTVLCGAQSKAEQRITLTFDTLPSPVNGTRQDVFYPGFFVTGGFVSYIGTAPSNKLYIGANPALCLGCQRDIVVYTSRGARDLTFTIRYAPGGAIITDGGTYFGGTGSEITIPVSTGQTRITYRYPIPFVSVSIDDISYLPPGSRDLSVHVDITNPNAENTHSREVPAVGPVTAQIAMGFFFKLRLTKRSADGTAEDVPFTATVESQTVAPALVAFGTHLAPEKNILVVDEATATATQEFIAIRMGKVQIKLAPTDWTIDPVTVAIDILSPSKLGDEENIWDAVLNTMAHERGVPPQYFKGQAAEESPNGTNLRRVSYRYEPCAGENELRPLLSRSPYTDYKLEDARGTTLPDLTLDERNVMYLPEYGPTGQITGRRHIVNGDTNVTASEIFKANDKWPIGGRRGLNWSNNCGAFKSWFRANPLGTPLQFAEQRLNFTAQTAMAASRGLFQVMYVTAVDEEWQARHPSTSEISRDPWLLQDTEENHRWQDGGSISVGTHYAARKIREPRIFDSRADYEQYLRDGFQRYNTHRTEYGSRVVSHSRRYIPEQNLPVFP